MSNRAYVYIDVSRKQEFIFTSNELKSNLYRSFIIKSLTEDLSQDHNFAEICGQHPFSYPTLTQFLKPWKHQFLFSGGGNSIVRFDHTADAKAFIREYTIEVLKHFPELELYISMIEETSNLVDQHIRSLLHERADQLKDQRRGQFRRWTYGIEKIDATGMPVLRVDPAIRKARQDEEKIVQQYMMAKLEKESASNHLNQKHFTVVKELQEYRKNISDSDLGKSYIGVIAIDGNQMGDIVKKVGTFEELRSFGRWIEHIYEQAVLDALKEVGEPDQQLKVTPIVMAGDDLCLITHAEQSLKLANQIVTNIITLSKASLAGKTNVQSDKNLPDELRQKICEDLGLYHLSACAGVAITKITYPFYESVKAAEDLCKQAKAAIYQGWSSSDHKPMPNLIDWQIVLGQTEPSDTLEQLGTGRRVEEQFHIKPLQMIGTSDTQADQSACTPFVSFSSFEKLCEELIKALQEETMSHTVLEKVRRAAYDGPQAYKRLFLQDQTGQLQRLKEIVNKSFSQLNLREDVPIVEDQERHTVTYVLHDVLEILPYLRDYWQSREGRGRKTHEVSGSTDSHKVTQ